MGVVSGAALQAGGNVTGVMPFAMIIAGGESQKSISDITVNGKMNGMHPGMVCIVVLQFHVQPYDPCH